MFGVALGIMDGAGGAAGGSYESIATAVGTGSASTISLTSIPSTYKHLQVRATFKTTGTGFYGDDLILRLNSDTGSNYAWHILKGNGSAASASGVSSTTSMRCGYAFSSDSALTDRVFTAIVDIHDYASTTKNKTVRVFSGGDANIADTSFQVFLTSGLWVNTSAVTSLTFSTSSALNWTSATQVSLYGIKG
jgi:hypothetical protein